MELDLKKYEIPVKLLGASRQVLATIYFNPVLKANETYAKLADGYYVEMNAGESIDDFVTRVGERGKFKLAMPYYDFKLLHEQMIARCDLDDKARIEAEKTDRQKHEAWDVAPRKPGSGRPKLVKSNPKARVDGEPEERPLHEGY